MDLSSIDARLIYARGQYATVNGEYKTLMATAQSLTQQACDALRHGLHAQEYEAMRENLQNAGDLVLRLNEISFELEELRRQKDELWTEAWGK